MRSHCGDLFRINKQVTYQPARSGSSHREGGQLNYPDTSRRNLNDTETASRASRETITCLFDTQQTQTRLCCVRTATNTKCVAFLNRGRDKCRKQHKTFKHLNACFSREICSASPAIIGCRWRNLSRTSMQSNTFTLRATGLLWITVFYSVFCFQFIFPFLSLTIQMPFKCRFLWWC
jgi:hypothetical protein